MLQVTITGDVKGVIEELNGLQETMGQGVEVGVMGVSEDKAMHSEVLEHRYHSEGPNAPEHWETGSEYVTWAFASRTARTMQDFMSSEIDKLLDDGVHGEAFWHSIGKMAVSAMKGTMANVMIPPNADSTIRQKGVNNPLIDTGEMKGSVTYEIKSSDELEDIENVPDNVPPAF